MDDSKTEEKAEEVLTSGKGEAKDDMEDIIAADTDREEQQIKAALEVRERLPWVEKYRPKEMSEVISHTNIVTSIKTLIEKDQLPHLLFYGPPGTGKTSTILTIARKLNGKNFKNMVLELNASDDRGIGVVRDEIKNFASSRQLFSTGLKLIILDEADAMTKTAQFALRRVIEQNTQNCRFCLICNYINKIIPALQSRCTRFRFGPLAKPQILGRLEEVAALEGVSIDKKGMSAIIKLAGGDMRKCLNVLQAAHLAYPKVTEETVYLCTGQPQPADIRSMMRALLNESFPVAFAAIVAMQKEKGVSLVDIVTEVHAKLASIDLPPNVLCFLMDKLSDIEARMAKGSTGAIQTASLVGVFQVAKEQLATVKA